jgi:DNA-binding response OmpR family regulator
MQTAHTTSILVIDDDPVVKDIVSACLAKDNYDLYFARTADDGLFLAKETTPDLILLDIMMPEVDGIEAFSKIRKEKKLQTIPVIFLSSIDDRDTLKKVLDLGADDFINKPFDRIEFRAKIRAITRINRTSFFQTVNKLESTIYEKDKAINQLKAENEELKKQLQLLQQIHSSKL